MKRDIVALVRSLVLCSFALVGGCQLVFPLDNVSDGADDGGTCTAQLDTDSENCGACEHSCHGGSCNEGVCQAVTLATGELQPNSIALSATHVFWTVVGGEAVRRAQKDGAGNVVTFASNQAGIRDVAIDETHVYWAHAGGISRCPIDGCVGSPEVLFGSVGAKEVAVGVTVFYFSSTASPGTVFASPKAVVSAQPISAGLLDVRGLVTSGNDLFFADRGDNRILRSISGATASEFRKNAEGSFALNSIALDATNLYTASSSNNATFAIEIGTSISRSLSPMSSPEFVAVAGDTVFFVGGRDTGYLKACAVDGCNGEAEDLQQELDVPVVVAADENDIYYATAPGSNDGLIVRLAR